MTVRILIGDVRAKLRELADDSIDCVVTSPPYWGLRDYDTGEWQGGDPACDHVVRRVTTGDGMAALGEKYRGGGHKAGSAEKSIQATGTCPKCSAVRIDTQIGLEPTLQAHLDILVDLCRDIRRVLKPEGTFWLNYGDCYAGSWGAQSREHAGKHAPNVSALSANQVKSAQKRGNTGSLGRTPGLKAKDLCMIPQRLAIALQEDGWWVRSILPWVKRNGMPESVTDRPASSVEYVIFLTKSGRYFYNGDAIRRPASANTHARIAQNVAAQAGSQRANGGAKTNGAMKAVIRRPKRVAEGQGIRANDSFENATCGEVLVDRNFRNSDLFFDSLEAPFGLISSADGVPLALDVTPQPFKEAHFATHPPRLVEPLLLAGCPKGGTVLDPFGGSGTTGLVADRLGLDCTLIELNPGYAEIADRRLRAGLARVEGVASGDAGDLPLFSGDAA